MEFFFFFRSLIFHLGVGLEKQELCSGEETDHHQKLADKIRAVVTSGEEPEDALGRNTQGISVKLAMF